MKKTIPILCLLLLTVAVKSFSQTTTTPTSTSTTSNTDFFAGKWEVAIAGTPMGDVKLMTTLLRKDGKLTGDLVNLADTAGGKRPITKVEESVDKLVIYFDSSQAGELSIELKKVDDDNLKGSLMTFDATAKRVKE